MLADPGRLENRQPALRGGGLALVALVSLANAISAVLLVRELLDAGPAPGVRSPCWRRGRRST